MRTARDTSVIAAAAAALVLGLTACTVGGSSTDPAQQPDLERTPAVSGQPLEPADTEDVLLPTQFDQLVTVEPAWDLPVQFGENIALSAEETDHSLVFHAVDSTGAVLWSAERPRNCSGFVVTEDAEGRELAVLTDTEPGSDAIAVLTASAYDLATGDPVWGPVELPGPHAGPGLVFQAPPEGFMGESGEAVALDPSTGQRLDADGGRALGEFAGTVVRATADALTGSRGNGEVLWEIPADGLGDGVAIADLSVSPRTVAATGLLLLDTGSGTGPVLDLATGTVLASAARDAAQDAGSATTALLDTESLRILDDQGDEQLTVPVSAETSLEAVVGVLVYLRDGSSVRVLNGVTGDVAQAYPQDGEGTIALPAHVTVQGTGTLVAGERTLLATTRVAHDQG